MWEYNYNRNFYGRDQEQNQDEYLQHWSLKNQIHKYKFKKLINGKWRYFYDNVTGAVNGISRNANKIYKSANKSFKRAAKEVKKDAHKAYKYATNEKYRNLVTLKNNIKKTPGMIADNVSDRYRTAQKEIKRNVNHASDRYRTAQQTIKRAVNNAKKTAKKTYKYATSANYRDYVDFKERAGNAYNSAKNTSQRTVNNIKEKTGDVYDSIMDEVKKRRNKK